VYLIFVSLYFHIEAFLSWPWSVKVLVGQLKENSRKNKIRQIVLVVYYDFKWNQFGLLLIYHIFLCHSLPLPPNVLVGQQEENSKNNKEKNKCFESKDTVIENCSFVLLSNFHIAAYYSWTSPENLLVGQLKENSRKNKIRQIVLVVYYDFKWNQFGLLLIYHIFLYHSLPLPGSYLMFDLQPHTVHIVYMFF
jgi:hypothetical protein